MNLLARNPLRDVVPINEFVDAVRKTRTARTPGQRDLLDNLTESDIAILQDKAQNVSAYKMAIEILVVAGLVCNLLLLVGVATELLTSPTRGYALKAGLSVFIACVYFLVWAAVKFGNAHVAIRLLRPAGSDRDVAEALKLTQRVPYCEAYRKEVLNRRSLLRVFDVSLLLEMGKTQRNEYEFYADELAALNEKEP